MTIAVKEFNSYIGDLTSGNYGITALEMTLDGDTQMLEDGIYQRLHRNSK